MQLKAARLCLDCEEVHEAPSCPVCASETFVYLTRWVPAVKPRTAPRPPRIVRPTRTQRILFGGGALGIAAYWVHRWSQRAREKVEERVETSGELR